MEESGEVANFTQFIAVYHVERIISGPEGNAVGLYHGSIEAPQLSTPARPAVVPTMHPCGATLPHPAVRVQPQGAKRGAMSALASAPEVLPRWAGARPQRQVRCGCWRVPLEGQGVRCRGTGGEWCRCARAFGA